ncbi:MAG: IPT/TIG domain-containing protein [Planctomycetota bacterium]
MRELDGALGTLTIRPVPLASAFNEVRQNTNIDLGADRSLLFFTEANISSGPVFTYEAAVDAFVAQRDTGQFQMGTIASVARDGSRIAMESGGGVDLFDPDLSPPTTLTVVPGGLIFSPVAELLYVVDRNADEIRVYDVDTLQVAQSFAIGENVGLSTTQGPGQMSISSDGSLLFLTTPLGVRWLLVGLPEPRVVRVTPARARFDAASPTVTVEGSFFSFGANPTISFGGVPATDVAVVDDATMTATLPMGANAGLLGPVEVVVGNDIGSDALAAGFVYTPAVLVEDVVAAGGSLADEHQFEAGSIVVGGLSFAPPLPAAVPFPGVDNTLCLGSLDAVYDVIWPFDAVTLSFAIPANLAGLAFQLQMIELPPLPPLPALPAFGNCATVTIQ